MWLIFEGNDLEGGYELSRSVVPVAGPSLIDSVKKTILGPIFTLPNEMNSRSIVADLINGELKIADNQLDSQDDTYGVDGGVELLWPLYSSKVLGDKLFHIPYVDRATKSESYVTEHPNIGELERVIGEMADLALAYDFDVTVVVAPSAPRLYGNLFDDFPTISDEAYFIDRVVAMTEAAGMDSLNLLPMLAPYAEDEMLYWRDDTHWNVRGHEIVAQLVEEHFYGN